MGLAKLGIEITAAVILTVAIGEEVREHEQIFKAEQSFLLGAPGVVMYSLVAAFADIIEPAPDVIACDLAEILVVNEIIEPVVVRRFEGRISGVHPLDSKLHSAAAGLDADICVDTKRFFGSYGGIGESRKLRLVF